jgi:serine/threonine protein kinase
MTDMAVKRASQGQGEAKLTNEITVLSAAPRHSGVVGVISAAAKGKAVRLILPPLLVMEFMLDGSLHDLLHRSPCPPPWPRRVGVTLDVVHAMRTLHAAAIVHHDVKPANVLLGRDGRAPPHRLRPRRPGVPHP